MSDPSVVTLTWSPPLQELGKALTTRIQRMMAAIWRMADNMAIRILTWMQINAPWKDITGDARAKLQAKAQGLALGAVIMIAHGVSYGTFLETMQAGRFAILVPAADYWMPIFFAAAQKIVKDTR